MRRDLDQIQFPAMIKTKGNSCSKTFTEKEKPNVQSELKSSKRNPKPGYIFNER